MHRAQAVYASARGDDASVIQRYAHLIERNARRISRRMPSDSAYDDLWSVGALGLLEAVERFDAQRGVRFEAFADHRIRGAMLDELRKMDNLPRRLRAQTESVAKAKSKLAQSLGRDATQEEIAAETGMDAVEVSELETVAQPVVALDDAVGRTVESGELPLDLKVERGQLSAQLASAISQLPERLQTLLSLYYVEELTLREIAKIFEVSEPRVCQLHKEAVSKLKLGMGSSAAS